jgi:sortase A
MSVGTAANDADPSAAPPLTGHRAAYVLGEVMLTLGLVILLFAGYEFIGKAWNTGRAQDRLNHLLDGLWANRQKPVAGQPVARLYIPRLHLKWAVIEGVTQADLRKGPGHYPKTDDPGDVGNVGIAGHRLPGVFWNLDRLRKGDPIVVETRSGWYVYRVRRLRVVVPTRVEVIAHNPIAPKRPATRRLLTLTTCNPKFNNYQRLVVQAELGREQAKKTGRPAELGRAKYHS